jgi:hypothetical protein
VGGFVKGEHMKEHTLLKVRDSEAEEKVPGVPGKVPDSTSDISKRLDSLQASLHSHLSNGTILEEKQDVRLKAVEERLMNLEGLLEKLVQRLVDTDY